MDIRDAQRELRTVYMGGFAGQLVSGILWLASAGLSTWVAPKYGMWGLFLGGMLIFPLTQLTLRLLGRKPALSAGNPLNQLAMQIAFTVPIGFVLVGAATLAKVDWFYPAAMIVVGAHYLPFWFLYGMKQFGLLAGLMVVGGILFGLYLPVPFATGGWVSGILLLLAAVAGPMFISREKKKKFTQI